jgi:hypothetical protein
MLTKRDLIMPSDSDRGNHSNLATVTVTLPPTTTERFVIFLRVLLKYLKQKDKSMFDKAKIVIRDCAQKNQLGDPHYTSLRASMQIHLKRLVGSMNWAKAEYYLSQFLKQQFLKEQQELSYEQTNLEKERFAIFTCVLLDYLKRKDEIIYDKAKMVIRVCAKNKKLGDPNYSSLNASMQIHLKRLVGSVYWKKAETYLSQYFKQQFLKKQQGMSDEQADKKARYWAKQAAAPLSTTLHPSLHLSQSHQQEAQQRQLHDVRRMISRINL